MFVKKPYKFLTGLDSPEFCQRVSDALADGYSVYGNPVMIMDGTDRYVGQAVILPSEHPQFRHSEGGKMTHKDSQPKLAATHKPCSGGFARSHNRETSEALYMTSGYVYDSAEQAEAAFAGEADNYVYARYGNPTVQMLEDRLASLEGAEACRATGSGMAAIFASMACMLEAGDRIVASRALFGACYAILTKILPRWGIETELVDGRDLAAWEAALSKPAKIVF